MDMTNMEENMNVNYLFNILEDGTYYPGQGFNDKFNLYEEELKDIPSDHYDQGYLNSMDRDYFKEMHYTNSMAQRLAQGQPMPDIPPMCISQETIDAGADRLVGQQMTEQQEHDIFCYLSGGKDSLDFANEPDEAPANPGMMDMQNGSKVTNIHTIQNENSANQMNGF